MSAPSTSAVVLGGGLTAMVAAAVLAQHVDAVTVIERDRLPDTPQQRPGVPQARHTHTLMDGGARALDSLLPGFLDRLMAAGAHRNNLPGNVVMLSAQGWMERFTSHRNSYTCSRNLLDFVVRDLALSNERITVIDHHQADDLIGDSHAVTGVRIRSRETKETRELGADLVIDATGRGSRIDHWLRALGLPEIQESTIDCGEAYASRVYRAPQGAEKGFPMINILADPGSGRPGRGVALLPIEDGCWMVTLGGTRGGEPPTDEEGFQHYVRHEVRHPLVADLIAGAQPVGPIHGNRSSRNRRRHFERLPAWPSGLIVLGDAVTTFNPVYGHGMSVSARGGLALRAGLQRHGPDPTAAFSIQQAVAKAAEDAWTIATTQDMRYPDVIGPRPTALEKLQRRLVDRMLLTATRQPAVAKALVGSFSLATSFTELARPGIALRTLRGPGRPPLTGPPLLPWERSYLPGERTRR
ncbi:FAD-dependent oxidoreductase [Streptomyces sp. NPDC058092]|uniref:FAD-dependent oxidoreductase n=1 Tax=Streptomyces sp. NPDC058092 TaxID=3346336 RepID=UPI0036EBDF91